MRLSSILFPTQIMTVLLSLIEPDAATPGKLQDVGKQLLSIRTKVNGEITLMIMLRESSGPSTRDSGDCDCGILGDVVKGLDEVIDMGEEKGDEDDAEIVEEGDDAEGDRTDAVACDTDGGDSLTCSAEIPLEWLDGK
jgi:hypothetical protein